MKPRHRSNRRDAGFTYVEVMSAFGVLVVGVLGFAGFCGSLVVGFFALVRLHVGLEVDPDLTELRFEELE